MKCRRTGGADTWTQLTCNITIVEVTTGTALEANGIQGRGRWLKDIEGVARLSRGRRRIHNCPC